MSRETRVMWFGSIFGGMVLLLFSAIGLNQYCKNIDTGQKTDDQSQNKSSKK